MFSFRAQIANIINSLFEPVSKILLSQFGGLNSQGAYELAYKTVSLTRNVIASGLFASLPVLTNLINKNKDEAKKFYLTSQKNITKTIFLAMILVVVVSPIISIIWTENINETYIIFVVFIALGFLFNTLGATAYNVGLASGVLKYNIVSTFIMLLVLIILSFVLGKILGVNGVVISSSISLATGGIIIKKLNEKLIL